MQARAHLRLIVSEPPGELEEAAPERLSMVQPVSSWRLRVQWLRSNGTVIALWSASVLLLATAAALVLARL